MSAAAAPAPNPTIAKPLRPARVRAARLRRWVVLTLVAVGSLGAAVWFGVRAYRNITDTKEAVMPTANVQRGDVTLTVTARGELQRWQFGSADGAAHRRRRYAPDVSERQRPSK